MLSTKLKEAAGNSADATLYVDDVFSTYLYTGNSSMRTITNGIDLAGKGGLVWIKQRTVPSGTGYHFLYDSARGYSSGDPANGYAFLNSNRTAAEGTNSETVAYPFNSDGFSLLQDSGGWGPNQSGSLEVSWTFRKAAKFFDVVTYTGTGSARTIAHSLGVAPGMVIVKRTDTTGNWQVYSNGLSSAANSIQLNLTNAQASAPTVWNSTAPTSSVFSVGTDATVNASGGTYVAYLYAHDTSSTGIIQCGSFTSSGSITSVNLGWEPQYVLLKQTNSTGDWIVVDSMRGFPSSGADATLKANTSVAEANENWINITSTGFTFPAVTGYTMVYMAIRRPNKPPTSGTQVYNYDTRGSTTVLPNFKSGFVVDMAMWLNKFGGALRQMQSRLTGVGYINMSTTAAEVTNNPAITFDYMNGFYNGTYVDANQISWMFKRAPGFFDVVCYTGTGVTRTVAHNLTVAPELMIVKARTDITQWEVYNNFLGNTKSLYLNLTDSQSGTSSWNNTTPTSTTFTVTNAANVNASTITYVAYLFATLAGISKVGSYTGNGSSQNIECGFAAGARFFLVKATSTTGSWWVWDSARGITAGNDPALQLNSTAAEITTADAVDPYSPGITVNQEATCSINANGVSYIFLAVA